MLLGKGWSHRLRRAFEQVVKGFGGVPVRLEMKRVRQLVGVVGGYIYCMRVPEAHLATDFTARLIPHHDGVLVPLQAAFILGQR